MTHVLHRDLRQSLPVAIRGDGPYLFDSDGKRYLDGSGGAAVSSLGHSHPAVVEAVQHQIATLPYAWTGFFTNEPMEELATRLVDLAPTPLTNALFFSSGTEATEAALKLARQWFVERGEMGRDRFIARRSSYHGNTLGALAVSGQELRRAAYQTMLAPTRWVSACHVYRGKGEGESDASYVARLAQELEDAIVTEGSDRVAAFLAETIVGASGGALVPVPGYFRAMREVCDRHGVLLVLDEVLCGLGRTGTIYAFDQEEVVPDLVTLGKGLGAGYQPLSAVVVSNRVVSAIAEGSGRLGHGQTFMGHAVACAAGNAVLRAIESEKLLSRVFELGAELEERLRGAFGDHPHVGDIRGRGLLWAIELVENREVKSPFPRTRKLAERIRGEALHRGLLCYPGSGTADGAAGDHVLLAPPFIIESVHLEEIVETLADTVDTVLAED